MGLKSIKPGDIFYQGGKGLSVAVGKKAVAVGGESQIVWEIRPLHNLQAPTMIPEIRIEKSNLRWAADKENLLQAFEGFFSKPFNAQVYFSQNETPVEKILQSLSPEDLVKLLRAQIGKDRIKSKAFKNVSVKTKEMIGKIVSQLADDLSMSSGLTFTNAKEHIFNLAFASSRIDLWPAQAGEYKLSSVDESAFTAAFGITPEQAMDLSKNPPKLIETTKRTIETSLLKERCKAIEPAKEVMSEQSSLSLKNNSTYNSLKHLAPSTGFYEAAFKFAAENLSEADFNMVAYAHLLKREHRKSVADLSGSGGLSERVINDIISKSILTLTQKALEVGKPDYILGGMKRACPEAAELLGDVKKEETKKVRNKARASRSSKKERPKAELRALIKEEQGKVAPTGFAALLYKHAVKVLDRDMFAIYVASDLRVKPKQETFGQIADRMSLSVTQVISIRNEAVKAIDKSLTAANVKRPTVVARALILADISKAPRKEDIAPPSAENKVERPDLPDEESIYAKMCISGYSSHDLQALGNIHEAREDYARAMLLYGAATDLLEGQDQALWQSLHAMEARVGTNYSSKDFSNIELYLQEKMNGKPSAPDLADEFAQAAGAEFDNDVSQDAAIDAEPIEDAVFEEVRYAQAEHANDTAQRSGVQGLSPRVVYALPPEIFVLGQRLKMVFNDAGNGSVEVTMELEAVDTSLRSDKDPMRPNGHATSGGLHASFQPNADGSGEIHVYASETAQPVPESGSPAPQ